MIEDQYVLILLVLAWFLGFVSGFSVGATYVIEKLKKVTAKRTTVQELNPNKWE